MTVIDLTASRDGARDGAREDAPGGARDDSIPAGESVARAVLTLPELVHVAALCDVALPFAVEQGPLSRVETRLGGAGGRDPELEALFDAVPDPGASLARRGLVDEVGAPAALLECVLRILAAPEVAVDVDLAVATGHGPVRARSLHHLGAGHVAVLSTLDGAVHEAALAPAARWPAELARTATPPPDALPTGSAPTGDGEPAVPDGVELPLDLVNAGVAAVHADRDDVLDALLARHGSDVRIPGVPDVPVQAGRRLVHALAAGTGRLRALVTAPTSPGPADQGAVAAAPARAGVLAWVLLADGWRWLQPVGGASAPRVRIRRVAPEDLATCLSPLIAQVLR